MQEAQSFSFKGETGGAIPTGVIRSAVNEEWANLFMTDLCDERPHKITYRAGFNTACWRFTKSGQHLITMGLGIQTTLKTPPPPDDYIKAFLRHENMHALKTEKDLKAIADYAKSKNVPFALVNLFEDARIEALGREHYGKPFEWRRWEAAVEIGEKTSGFRVLNGIFNIIQADGDLAESGFDADLKALLDRAVYYYSECCKLKSTQEIVLLAERFVKEFPEVSQGNSPDLSFGGRAEDMVASLTVGAEEERALEEAGNGEVKEEEVGTHVLEEFSTEDILGLMRARGRYRNTNWAEEGAKMALLLSREIKSNSRVSASIEPSHRLSARNLAMDRDDVFLHRREETQGRVKIGAIIDCSGSMAGGPSHLARVICKCLSDLARMGLIEGVVVLSGTGPQMGGATQSLSLPMPDEDVQVIEGYGYAENIERSFQLCSPALRQMNLLFCVTDGIITDAPIDVDALRRKRMNIIALYANNSRVDPEHLLRWFPQAIHRESTEEIISEVAHRFRRQLQMKTR